MDAFTLFVKYLQKTSELLTKTQKAGPTLTPCQRDCY